MRALRASREVDRGSGVSGGRIVCVGGICGCAFCEAFMRCRSSGVLYLLGMGAVGSHFRYFMYSFFQGPIGSSIGDGLINHPLLPRTAFISIASLIPI